MRPAFSLLFLVLFSPSLMASNSCLPEETISYRGIECCLSPGFSQAQCEGLVNQWSDFRLAVFADVQERIRAGAYELIRVPNCHWASMSFFEESVLDQPETVYERDFAPWVRQKFRPIGREEMLPGDLVVFSAIRYMDPDISSGAPRIEVKVPFHSALFLGQNLIFQKDNHRDEVMSIVDLDVSFQGYDRTSRSQTGERLVRQFYRLQRPTE